MANKASADTKRKLAGLIAILVGLTALMAFMWPRIHALYEAGGMTGIVQLVHDSGPLGMLTMIGIQVVQIIIAPIPGEVVEVASGMIYGPWLGTLLLTMGNVIATAIIFQIVHKLGAPFVQEVVSTEHLEKFQEFERSGKLGLLTFVLFLLPGMPKDTFTYLLSLTNMKMKQVVVITTIARLPVLFCTLLAADGLFEGNSIMPVILLFLLVALAVLAVIKRDWLMNFMGQIDV